MRSILKRCSVSIRQVKSHQLELQLPYVDRAHNWLSGREERQMPTAIEFFAGMGLVRAGLERAGISTIFAHDVCRTKQALYLENWGSGEFQLGDICQLSGEAVPKADIATASFPCVDLSVAGRRKGLNGSRSGLVFEFLRVLDEMGDRAPPVVMLENVTGFMTVNNGSDWRSVIDRLNAQGYRTRHLCVDAKAFVPQSRVRVFIIGCRDSSFELPEAPNPKKDLRLSEIADRYAEWWAPKRLGAFLTSLSPIQEERLASFQRMPNHGYFGAFRRTRSGVPRWEVRADQIAGALRTTRGGSAKQAIVRAGQGGISARWMNVAEYARLQGAEHLSYCAVTPQQAMFALGDAVCVPVIEWIGKNCIAPLIQRRC